MGEGEGVQVEGIPTFSHSFFKVPGFGTIRQRNPPGKCSGTFYETQAQVNFTGP